MVLCYIMGGMEVIGLSLNVMDVAWLVGMGRWMNINQMIDRMITNE
jgi:hypothetical protein